MLCAAIRTGTRFGCILEGHTGRNLYPVNGYSQMNGRSKLAAFLFILARPIGQDRDSVLGMCGSSPKIAWLTHLPKGRERTGTRFRSNGKSEQMGGFAAYNSSPRQSDQSAQKNRRTLIYSKETSNFAVSAAGGSSPFCSPVSPASRAVLAVVV